MVEKYSNTYYKISLRVKSYCIKPEDIAKRLGLEPDIVRKASEGTARKRPYHYCTFRDLFGRDNNEQYLGDRIKEIVLHLEQHKELISTIRKNGGTFELFIGWFIIRNGMVDFESSLLEKTGMLGIDLCFDAYDNSY